MTPYMYLYLQSKESEMGKRKHSRTTASKQKRAATRKSKKQIKIKQLVKAQKAVHVSTVADKETETSHPTSSETNEPPSDSVTSPGNICKRAIQCSDSDSGDDLSNITQDSTPSSCIRERGPPATKSTYNSTYGNSLKNCPGYSAALKQAYCDDPLEVGFVLWQRQQYSRIKNNLNQFDYSK